MTKLCKKCGARRPTDQFSRLGSAPDGLAYTCKECIRVYDKQYYQLNRDKIKARQKDYDSIHIQQRATYDKQRREGKVLNEETKRSRDNQKN